MKKTIAALLCAVMAMTLLLCPVLAADSVAAARTAVLEKNLAENGVKDVQSWLDTALTASAGTGAEWYVLSFAQSGESYDYTRYAAALQKHVEESTETSAATREKLALAFLAAGVHSDYTDTVAKEAVGKLGLMSWVFGMHLANNGVETEPGREEILATLLDMQFDDGGWAVTGDKGDPDATSMVLQAVAPCRERPDVAAAIDRALPFLSEKQQPYGGYISFGMECPDSIAQVMIALAALDIDALRDERFIKNGNTMLDAFALYELPDGTYAHSQGGRYNALSTVETFMALTAYERQQRGEGSLYLFPAPTREIADVLAAAEALEKAEKGPDSRLLLCAAAAGLAVLVSVLLLVKGKKSWKNFAAVWGTAAVLCYLVFSVRVEKTEDYYGSEKGSSGPPITTTISIRCDRVAGEREDLPADGWILAPTEITLSEGDDAFDQLVAAARKYSIHIDKTESGISAAYMRAIANLYEYDFGELSGWMYNVNGKYADVGCGEYELRDGDTVEWRYTLELGRDIGDDYVAGE